MPETSTTYPVSLSIDYPDRNLNRLTTFFRIITVIPIGFVAVLLAQTIPPLVFSSTTQYNTNSEDWNNFIAWINSGGTDFPSLVAITAVLIVILSPIILFLGGFILNLFNPIVLMLAFRQKYPKWWFDFYVALIKFLSRVFSYTTLLTDIYPSTDEDQNVHFEVPYPDAKKDLSQVMPLFKWFLAIPHYIVLCFVGLAAFVADVIIWFAILFTGRVPRGLFDFVVGFHRWALRVAAYAIFQFTDKYPPFSLG